jgi:hypothetical protein
MAVMEDIERQNALRAHDRLHSYREATNEAIIKAGEVAIRTVMIVNGGAAVSVLAFLGALAHQEDVTVKDMAGISSSLLWFGGGVAAAAWALALSYFTNYCYSGEEGSKVLTWKHPYIEEGTKTLTWRRWARTFHLGAIVWAVLALAFFIIGMFDVRNAIVRLGS